MLAIGTRNLTISANKETYYLVIDQGGHATRAIVFDESGDVVCGVESAIKTMTPDALKVEHQPDDLMRSIYSVIDQVSQILGDDYQRINRAGLATQRSSIVCWNKKTGEPLSPIISWQDRRTNKSISQYDEHAQYIHDVTGLYLNPHYGSTKMRWCFDNLPEVKKEYRAGNLCVAPMASYILFHLLENKPFVIDPANASRSLLMNYKTLAWQPELLDIFSISEAVLPKIVWTKYEYGNIKRHGHIIPLTICTGDQSAAVFSGGRLLFDEVFVNAGTGAFILKPNEEVPDLKTEKILASVVYADEKTQSYVTEGTVNGAGCALQWLSGQSKIDNYEAHLDEWCEQFREPPVFINAISGIGSPYWVADFQSYFSREADDEEKFVAVLESIIFLISENIISIQNVSSEIKQIRLAGGISKSKAFCQKMANLLKIKVVLDEETEATAKGVFYLLKKTEVGKNKENNRGFSVVFHPKNDQMLHNRYESWKKVMTQCFT